MLSRVWFRILNRAKKIIERGGAELGLSNHLFFLMLVFGYLLVWVARDWLDIIWCFWIDERTYRPEFLSHEELGRRNLARRDR